MQKRGGKIISLYDFKREIRSLRKVKASILKKLIKKKKINKKDTLFLKRHLEKLNEIKRKDKSYILKLDKNSEIKLNLDYEIEETKRDILFLERGKEALYKRLEKQNPKFRKEVEKAYNQLKDLEFKYIISDRDGTINNYAERYYSSTQSIYNGYLLSNLKDIQKLIILSSAPLNEIKEVNIIRSPKVILAGSKGLEFEEKRKTKRYPIPKDKLKLVDKLGKDIKTLLRKKEYKKFSLIGSGYQKKFGQITIARQDIQKSIPEKESKDFLIKIRELVKPSKNFVIRDTKLDIEITLKKEGKKVDFTKKEGINFILNNIDKEKEGNILICGDTAADLEMLKIKGKNPKEIYSIFITKNIDKKSIKNSIQLSCPDSLLATLNKLGDKDDRL